MKCEECGGTGKVQKWFYERTGFGKCEKVCGDVKCEWCNGTGEVEQTEQEFIQTCDTEQLAEFINDVSKKCYTCGEGYTAHPAYCPFHKCLRGSVYGITEWLKQPHTNEVGK